MLFWFKVFSSASRFQRFQTPGTVPSYRPAVTGQQLPARNPTTETTEHTEREPSSFRGFRVFRGLKSFLV